ncbi:hypothetical protein Tco_0655749 [Tanacetum coccineum]|uniref:Uncharacterized protein n=1 Tax=Tanacetum coccineum TaxID=301880 RepID=A0ABQ4X7I1_9ASTR
MKADPLLQEQDKQSVSSPDKFEKTPNNAKRHKTSEYEAYVSERSTSGQDNVRTRYPTNKYHKTSWEEISLTIDEAKLKMRRMRMLRRRSTFRDEHQGKRERILVLSASTKDHTISSKYIHRDPEAPISISDQSRPYVLERKENSVLRRISFVTFP